MKNFRLLGKTSVVLLLVMLSVRAEAQFLRTSYFMEGTHYRQQLNPALTPGRGYINIPAIGSLNASINSSTFGYQDVIDIIDNSDDSDYFMSDDFINRLKATNTLNTNVNMDIISAGWYKGKNFWSFNIGLRTDIGATIPKSMFEFMREMRGVDFNSFNSITSINWQDYQRNIGGEKMNVTAYTEIGLGFARDINSRLKVGARVKALLGLGNMELEISKMNVNTTLTNVPENIDWENIASNYSAALELAENINGNASVDVAASLETSFKGLELVQNEDGYIDDFDFEASEMGIAGYGASIDLGASYRLTDKLTLSASVLDLGFIKWSNSCTQTASARSSDDLKFSFEGKTISQKVEEAQRFADLVSSGEVLNYDMVQMAVNEGTNKSRTSRLTTTVVAGAEYALLGNWLAVGALYTGRFAQPKALHELTFSANIRPKNYFNLAASYSVLQGAGKTFGVAMKLGPLFIGTDYMFLGENTKNLNAYFGLSIPLGKQKKG